MSIICRDCSVPIPTENVNIERCIAKCDECGAVFAFEDQLAGEVGGDEDDGSGGQPVRRPRTDVALPRGMRASADGGDLILERRWRGSGTVFLVLFALAWNGFLVFWYVLASKPGTPMMMKIFPIIHVAVGIGVAYGAIASLFNSTRIRAGFHELTVRQGPIPVRGSRTLPSDRIQQIHCRKRVSRSNESSNTASYEVRARMIDGQDHKLVGNLRKSEEATYIEQELERALGIEDRGVD